MNIQSSKIVPNSTYFTQTDVEPAIDQATQTITIYNGKGDHRSWGAPQVTSTVVMQDCDLVAIHVGFSHKHRGGQAWYYFTTDGSEIRRVKWQQLPDETRSRILAAAHKAPVWAKSPGKLSSERTKPTQTTRIGYKIVRVLGDGAMVSLYDGTTTYEIGRRLVQKAQNDHNGGYYTHPSIDQVTHLWARKDLVPERCYTPGEYAIIECEIAGNLVEYPNGKIASTYLTPIRIVEQFSWQ